MMVLGAKYTNCHGAQYWSNHLLRFREMDEWAVLLPPVQAEEVDEL